MNPLAPAHSRRRLPPWWIGASLCAAAGLCGCGDSTNQHPSPAAVSDEPALLAPAAHDAQTAPRMIPLPTDAAPALVRLVSDDNAAPDISSPSDESVETSAVPLLPPLVTPDATVESIPVDLDELERRANAVPVASPAVEAPAETALLDTTPAAPLTTEISTAPDLPRESPASAAPTSPPATSPLPVVVEEARPVAGPVAPAAALAVQPPRERTAELEAVAQRADEQIRRGFSLANKRAFHSAHREFIEALRTLAQALDAEQGTMIRDKALTAGLRALAEADELQAAQARGDEGLDVERLTAGHRTPALDGLDPSALTVVAVIQRYYAYAQEQFAAAVDHEVAGSMALYGLGKMHGEFAQERPAVVLGAEAKAVAFHQAALIVDSRNALAANELGVVLARFGRLADARSALWHSLMMSPTPAAWHNLSVVHQRLGERELAERAERESTALAARMQGGAARSKVAARWVEPSEFARTAPAADGTPVERAASKTQPNKQ